MKEKILLISAFPPGNETAGQNLTKNLIMRMADKYEIDMIYFTFDNKPNLISLRKNIMRAKEIKINKVLSAFYILIGLMFLINPIFSRRFSIKTCLLLRKMAKENNYKYIIFNFSQVFLYSLFVGKSNSKKIFIIHDVIAQLFSRRKGVINKILYILAIFNEKILFSLNKSNYYFAISEKDRNILYSNYGIDSKVFHVYLESEIMSLKLNRIKIDNMIVLYGAWNRPENMQTLKFFFRHVYPKIVKNNINLKVCVVGGGISKSIYSQYISDENVQIIGFVENPYLYLARAKCLFAPLFGGAGVKVKVIESLACGTPVLGTNITFEGIEFKEGMILIKNSEDAVEKILEITKIVDKNYKINLREKFLSYYADEKYLLDKLIDDLNG
ncbi:MAG TPA: glycosyltransferase [Persephonella sp.]|nr:glycosyltransferase [Persephonella sp.]